MNYYESILNGGVKANPGSAHFLATVSQLFHASSK
ncbi:MAG: hypothetical protein JWM43_3969 [Acidobacteriaceae bacterium]|nr:hypothetical protein [Acidobacteriaceae bacterium]